MTHTTALVELAYNGFLLSIKRCIGLNYSAKCLCPFNVRCGGSSREGTSLSAGKAAFASGLATDTFGFFTSAKKVLTDVSFRQKAMKFFTRLSREVASTFFPGDEVVV